VTKIITIVGARPQFVKAAMVSFSLGGIPGIEEILVHTGQHYDANMSKVFFDELKMRPPDRSLGVGSGSHARQTGLMMMAIEEVVEQERPDWIVVYGDTNSTLAAAVVAAKLRIRLMHVEAGLRSFNRAMPEEINRILTDRISDALMVPTAIAEKNLLTEGHEPASIHLVGDVMYDAALHFSEESRDRWAPLASAHRIEKGAYALATIHRAENTDEPRRLAVLFEGLAGLAHHLPVVLPLHPRTRAKAGEDAMRSLSDAGVRLIEPVGYLDMIQLETHAAVIATDSGGVQKEAFFYRVPCVTLRTETEWLETVRLKWNRICPMDSPQAISGCCIGAIGTRGGDGSPYGTGDAAERIAAFLARDARKTDG